MTNFHSELLLSNLPPLFVRLVSEDKLSSIDHISIKKLLVSAFPQFTEIFTLASYWGARPLYRLWIETQNSEILSHLHFGHRTIMIGKTELLITGVGAVATHPKFQKHGLGRALMEKLHKILMLMSIPFGYLQCHPAVIDFYVRVGWHPILQTSCFTDPDTNQLTFYKGPTLILPACETLSQWPSGMIDLKGMPW